MNITAYRKLGDRHYEIYIEQDINSMSEYRLCRQKARGKQQSESKVSK